MSLGGGAFEKGKRGPNESKVKLFTIGSAFLASGLNVTINEKNLMFEKKYFSILKSILCIFVDLYLQKTVKI